MKVISPSSVHLAWLPSFPPTGELDMFEVNSLVLGHIDFMDSVDSELDGLEFPGQLCHGGCEQILVHGHSDCSGA